MRGTRDIMRFVVFCAKFGIRSTFQTDMDGKAKENKENKKSAGLILAGCVKWILIYAVSTVLVFALFIVGTILVLVKGPSEKARYIFVNSCNETSALKFVPYLFLDKETVDTLLGPQETETDDYKELGYKKEPDGEENGETGSLTADAGTDDEDEGFVDGIRVDDVKGPNYRGKMMIVKDPMRVVVGVLDNYGEGIYGQYLYEYMDRYKAVGGINAGGFVDVNGSGTGGIPDGIVIKDGKLKWGAPGAVYWNFIGIDKDGCLKVGSWSAESAISAGVVDGVSFSAGSVLVQDGKAFKNLGGGVNPRTAVGQREDGTWLLLAIEGRHAGSLGASKQDLVDIMIEYGAVNAAMLDGGSSTDMMYNGESLIRGSGIIGMRRLPNTILVLPEAR